MSTFANRVRHTKLVELKVKKTKNDTTLAENKTQLEFFSSVVCGLSCVKKKSFKIVHRSVLVFISRYLMSFEKLRV